MHTTPAIGNAPLSTRSYYPRESLAIAKLAVANPSCSNIYVDCWMYGVKCNLGLQSQLNSHEVNFSWDQLLQDQLLFIEMSACILAKYETQKQNDTLYCMLSHCFAFHLLNITFIMEGFSSSMCFIKLRHWINLNLQVSVYILINSV